MLTLFFIRSLSIAYDRCVAPTSLAAPVPNATLLQVQVLIRHGSRTPGSDFFNSGKTQEWICDSDESHVPRVYSAPVKYPRDYIETIDTRSSVYKPNCRPKDLLVSGMQQHYELGRAYRQRYVDELHLLPTNFDPRYVFIRATELDRTVRSGMSFMQGMYEPVNGNEVIDMVTDNDAAGVLHPSDEWCSEIKDIGSDLFELPKFKDYFDNFTAKFKNDYESVVGEWEPKRVKKMCSYILMTDCSNHSLPTNISNDLIGECQNLVNYYQFMQHDNDKYRGVASSPLLREMIKIADNSIGLINDYKFVLLSSHDSALSAILSTLGYEYLDQPAIQVRSHLDFELWELNNAICGRFVFNGKVLKLPFLSEELFLYANLKLELMKLGYLNHCMIPEWK